MRRNPYLRAVLSCCLVAGSFTASGIWDAQSALAQQPPGQGPGGAKGPPDSINEEEYAKDANTEINVKNADIAAIVRIFSRKTKRNYILDERVKGKVSIYLPGKVSSEESLRILDSVLALKGFTSVPIGENLWKIVPSKDARQSTIPTLTTEREGTASSAMVTRLVSLKYVNAEDVQQILAQLISPDGLINAYTGTNSLILIDNEDNIERLAHIIDELDVPAKNRDLTIIPVKYADVQDLADKLLDILGEGNNKKGEGPSDLLRTRLGDLGAPAGLIPPPPGQPRMARAAANAAAAAASQTVARRGVEPKIIPDQRTNSIIVVADDDTTARVQALIAQLDSKIDLSGNKFYVYRCQHANAEELAQVLAGLAGGSTNGGTGGLGGTTNRSGSSSGGLGGMFGDDSGTSRSSSRSSLSSSRSGSGSFGGSGSSSMGSRSSRSRNGSGNGPMTAQLGENISLTADPATNSLIIAASKTDYEKLRSLITQLDVKRRQVLVEATLLEVSVDNNLRLNTGFLSSTGGSDGGVLARSDFGADGSNLRTLFSNPANLQGFTLAAASSGSLTLPGGITIPTQSVLVSAAQASNNVNVLSAPTILATDNEEAQIVVGQNVPFLASTSTNATNLNNTFNQIERQDVGITLKITPQISSRDYVTLTVFTEVSAVVGSTADSSLGPTTTKRQSETTIIAKDAQMIVTGGLISDDVSETDSGVPFLKDIPVLGHAFKSNSQARAQKNLLIFMTPRIVKDQFDARDTTLESREKMRDVIASYGVEPHRDDVLESHHIDSVAESSDYSGPKPGTIRPSAKNTQRSSQTSTRGADDTIILDGSSDDGVLDLGAVPLLPEGSQAESSVVVDDPIAKRAAALKGSSSVQASGDQFIVVEMVKGDSPSEKDIPFLLGNKSHIAGLIMPRESSDSARSFFQAGSQYRYVWNDQEVRLRVVGIFSSIPEAHSVHPNIPEAWYTFSPYEIMNLGKGPWVSGR